MCEKGRRARGRGRRRKILCRLRVFGAFALIFIAPFPLVIACSATSLLLEIQNRVKTAKGGEGVLQTAATPKFSLPEGTYSTPQTVIISTTTPAATIRYTTDGRDPSDTVGTAYTGPLTISTSSTVKAVAYAPGWNQSAIGQAVYVFVASGTLDASFGVGGRAVTDFGLALSDYGFAAAVQSDGKAVVAGLSHNGSNLDFALARYRTDGSLDTGFGTGGTVRTDFGSGHDAGYAVALQSDGKIIVAGKASNGVDYDFALARYTIGGNLDTAFGTGGKITIGFGSGNDGGRAISIQNDGKIIVAGSSFNGVDDDFALMRYTTDGNVDTAFGSGGGVITDFGASPDYGYAAAVQTDGKIVVAGYSKNGTNNDFALARYFP